MTIDAERIHRSFEALAHQEGRLARAVYDRLFGRHPELVELFTQRHSAGGAQMIRETLMYAVDHLDGAGWVAPNLASLGAKHVDYEVTEEMYGWFIDALIDGMGEIAGDPWSAELAADWQELFRHLADLMIAELPDAGIPRATGC